MSCPCVPLYVLLGLPELPIKIIAFAKQMHPVDKYTTLFTWQYSDSSTHANLTACLICSWGHFRARTVFCATHKEC